MNIDEDDYLAHYGTPRHSGRYPWGSGGDPSQKKHMDLIDLIEEQRTKGLSDPEIAAGMGITTTKLRAQRTIANSSIKQSQIKMAQSLVDKGYSNVAGGKRMGINESVFRTLIAPGAKEKADNLMVISNALRDEVAKAEVGVDIGSGVEHYYGVSQEKLRAASDILKEEGYNVHPVNVKQQATGLDTKMKVLVAPGVTQREAWLGRYKVSQISQITSEDGGRSFTRIHEPLSLHQDRVAVRYRDDKNSELDGSKADGVLYVRPGVQDLSLGKSRYAQVRVKVGDGHYLKGMAMYKDDLPKGTDVVFNTAKKDTGNKLDAMKPVGDDKNFPFGTIVDQVRENAGTPQERVVSVMNLVNEEGDWGKWAKSLSSQFLSKQSPALAKSQLNKTFEQRRKDLDEINSLTNPTVKKKLLKDFADSTDSAAVHLKAAAFSGASYHAILPLDSIKPTEVYAPSFDNGTTVALVRYPHGGKFEIPILTVNNKNREGRSLLPEPQDAIGIHHAVAQRLSGADFDGDTVLVIPNNDGKVKNAPALEGLKNFDPIHEYPKYDGMAVLSPQGKQAEMGKISNLITDMTLQGAPNEHLVRAVRHSMVVIDAEKHELNYRESAIRNGIPALKEEYQGGKAKGAATLISRKKQVFKVPERKGRLQSSGGPIDPVTGRLMFEPTGGTRIKDGVRELRTTNVKKLLELHDSHDLSGDRETRIEAIYADHSNRLKDLANEARISLLKTPNLVRNPSASRVYKREVDSLDAKLMLIERNRPRERRAQTTSSAAIKAIFDSNPELTKEKRKKIRFAELEKARARAGATQDKVNFTDEEWNAVQSGAISEHKLSKILQKSDMKRVRQLATPKREHTLSNSQTQRAQSLLNSGATRIEVARTLGIPLSALDKALSLTTSSS